MHQQVRTSTKKTGASSDGPGAMADEGGLVDILRILEEAGINLRAAGGRDLDDGGVFAFAVEHHAEDGDTDGKSRAVQLLEQEGYAAHDVKVHDCYVTDEPGALRKCIEEVEARSPVYEIFVGTPEPDGRIPVQLTTRAEVGADYER